MIRTCVWVSHKSCSHCWLARWQEGDYDDDDDDDDDDENDDEGCLINPAGMYLVIQQILQMGLIRAVLYMLAQTCGAILGAGILWTFTTNEVQRFW